MKNIKRIISFLFMICALSAAVLLFAPLKADAATYSGDCSADGSSVGWVYDSSAKTLTVTGSGYMKNYTYSSKAPWYQYRSGISTVVIGEGVKGIGNYAFYDYSAILTVSFPDSLERIGGYSFYKCAKLEGVALPANLGLIGYNAFAGCDAIPSLVIPSSLHTLEENAFSGCDALSYISIPSTLSTIPANAFSGCVALTEIVIPDGVQSIGARAFSGCSGLKKVTLPPSLTEIGESAFFCYNIEQVHITDISSWLNLSVADTYADPLWDGGEIYLNGIRPVYIAVPAGITKLRDYAFNRFSMLETVDLHSKITCIGKEAFSDCKSLREINVPSSVTSIGEGAFRNCVSIEHFTLPSGVTSVANSLLNGCTGLKSVTLHSKVKSIGTLAFVACGQLSAITIPSGVTSIGARAFEDCDSLTSIRIPSGVTSIGERTFWSCTSLKTVIMSANVMSIGESAFESCTKLTSISGITGVKSIADRAFYNCRALKAFAIPDGLTYIGEYCFSWCKSIEKINIKAGVTEIGHGAFSNCSNLMEVYTAEGLKTIGPYAFYDCDRLTLVVLPKSLETMGEMAFERYQASTSVWHLIYRGTEIEWQLASQEWDTSLSRIATCHYSGGSSIVKSTVTLSAACITEGKTSFECTVCGKEKIVYLPEAGHDFDGVECTKCGVLQADLLESGHGYEPDSDISWTIEKPGAMRIALVFSSQTAFEPDKDFLYIYDAEGDLIGKYTATALASKRIVVHSSAVRIRLTSDSSYSYYGFALTDVRAYYDECLHDNLMLENTVEPDCTNEGYSGDGFCEACQRDVKGSVVAALGHSFGKWSITVRPTDMHEGCESRFCSACGHGEHNVIAKIIIRGNGGDLDNDGRYTNKDITFVVRHLSGQSIYDDGGYASLADINGDGRVNNRDAITVILIVAESTEEDKFEGYTAISTQAGLEKIKNDLTGKYYLECDITLDGAWTPIGGHSAPFTGILDGDGHKITGLNIDSTAVFAAGLFGYNNGTVSNLTVEGDITVVNLSNNSTLQAGGIAARNNGRVENCILRVDITLQTGTASAYVYAGGIVGYSNAGSSVAYCKSESDVSAVGSNNSYAGGIAGYANGSSVEGCESGAGVSSYAYGGGIIGQAANQSEVTRCTSNANVSAKTSGGICGCLTNSSIVSRCHNAGQIEGGTYCGGIVGRNYAAVEDCLNTNDVLADTYYAGGIVGYNESAGSIAGSISIARASVSQSAANGYAGGIAGGNLGSMTDCYYLNTMTVGSGRGTDSAIRLDAQQMKTQASFGGFDFNDVWTMGDNCPKLR